MATLRKIAIETIGSRGDCQPYVALGIMLKERGYDVMIASNLNHEAFVTSYGLKFYVIASDVGIAMKDPQIQKAMAEGNPQEFFGGLVTCMEQDADKMVKNWLAAMDSFKPDLLISGSMSAFGNAAALYILRIPAITVLLSTYTPQAGRPIGGLPALPCGLNKWMATKVFIKSNYDTFVAPNKAFVEQTGKSVLDAYTYKLNVEDALTGLGVPSLVAQPAKFGKVMHPTCKQKFMGSLILESHQQVQQQQGKQQNVFGDEALRDKMQTFIDAGKKPVYMGWGSMTCRSPEYMSALVAKAIVHSGERAIVLGGWAGLSLRTVLDSTKDASVVAYVEKNVLFVESAPHEWLFPKVACCVHHGGTGTLVAGLKAGVPAIVTPVYLDQWDHAYLVNELGCGVGMTKQFQQMSAEELGDAIKLCCSSSQIKTRATEVGNELKLENGTANISDYIEKEFWPMWVQSGKHQQLIDGRIENSRREKLSWWAWMFGR